MELFNQGTMENFTARPRATQGAQFEMFGDLPGSTKGLRTRNENQIKMHLHRMQERRAEIENMRLGLLSLFLSY
jgi:hypothetical protein